MSGGFGSSGGSAGGTGGGGSGRAHFRSQLGCCICGTKSSSSRFTASQRYAEHFGACFGPRGATRSGDLCNACVLCVKRWLQRGKQPNFFVQVLDSKKGPGPKHMKEITKRARRREAKQKAAAAAASSTGREQKSLKFTSINTTTTIHAATTRSSCGNGHYCPSNNSGSRGNLHHTQISAKSEHLVYMSSSSVHKQSTTFCQQSCGGSATTRSSVQHLQPLSNGHRCSSHSNIIVSNNPNYHNRSIHHITSKNSTMEHRCCPCAISNQEEYLSGLSYPQGATRTRAAAARQLEAASAAAAACARNIGNVLSCSSPICDSHHRRHQYQNNSLFYSTSMRTTTPSEFSEYDGNNICGVSRDSLYSETSTSTSSCSSCCYCCCCSGGRSCCCNCSMSSLSGCSVSTSGFGSNSSNLSFTSPSSNSYCPGMKSTNTGHNKKQQNISDYAYYDDKTVGIKNCSVDCSCSTHQSYQCRHADEFRYPQPPHTGQASMISNTGNYNGNGREKNSYLLTNGNSENCHNSNNIERMSCASSAQNKSIVNINESATSITNTNTSSTSTMTIPTRRYNRRVVLPPVRMTHNPEVDSLLREIMERNSQAVNFDSREMHMAVQQELRLRNRTIHTAASASGGSISSISSADGSVETNVGSNSQTSTNSVKCDHHHHSPIYGHSAKRHCSHHCCFSHD